MAIDMSTVKAITHNNKDVVKIEDSLGNILWQKQVSKAYRELDCIKFSGSEYILSYLTPGYGKKLDIKFKRTSTDASGCLFSSYGSSFDVSARTYNFAFTATNTGYYTIGNTNLLYDNSKIARNQIYTTSGNVTGSSGSLNFRAYLYDASGTQQNTKYLNNQNKGVPTTAYIYLMTQHTTNNSNYATGEIYLVTETSNNTETHRLVPCQRKSDNKCGLYDTVSGAFRAMSGTNTTTTAAGSTVDENPSWSPDA